jgi:uncharacterized protein (TIGR01777 family)
MKVVLPGGSGHLGTLLARTFASRGHEVVVIRRGGGPQRASGSGRAVTWDGRTIGPWASEIDGADAVINLAGRSVNCRYTEDNLREILASRVDSTRVVGEAVAAAARPPRVWLQASAATVYAHGDGVAHGETGLFGGSEPGVPGYWAKMVEVVREWEAAFAQAKAKATRKVALRISLVMSPDRGGAFDVLLGLVRKGLGGRAGDGRQYVSWIVDGDFVRVVDWLIERSDLEGPINVTAPVPLPNADLMRGLREAWGARIGLPAAAWMVDVGAWALRTDPELVLKSRRVVPERLLSSGFRFDFPEWPAAAKSLVERWKAQERAR